MSSAEPLPPPGLVRNESAGFYEFVSRDVSTISCPMEARNVEPLKAVFGGTEIIGFRVWDDARPTSDTGVEGAVDAYERAVEAFRKDRLTLTGGEFRAKYEATFGAIDERTVGMRAALATLHPPHGAEPVGVTVKPLVWSDSEAETSIGIYRIEDSTAFLGDANYDLRLLHHPADESGILITSGLATWNEASDRAQADYEARIRSALAPSASREGATHRHVKHGTEYVLIGIGRMQAEKWFQQMGWETVPVDMNEVAIYHSATDPTQIWARPREEFEDGRFVALAKQGGAS